MVNKKTVQRRKKQRKENFEDTKRQKVYSGPENTLMTCENCERSQKNRVACYFCNHIQRLMTCAECGRIKCLGNAGDCLVKHTGRHATGLAFIGAICDFCEAPVCHSVKCIDSHACSCSFRVKSNDDVVSCYECERTGWEHGGRMWRCATCDEWLCEDDQFEHQASCQYVDCETFNCQNCSRTGVYVCLKCKICFCLLHYKSQLTMKYKAAGDEPVCKKCRRGLKEIHDLSVSVRKYKYGRHKTKTDNSSDDGDAGGGAAAYARYMAGKAEQGSNDSSSEYEDESESDEEDGGGEACGSSDGEDNDAVAAESSKIVDQHP